MTDNTVPTAPETQNTAPVVVEQQEVTTPEPNADGGQTAETAEQGKTPEQLRIEQLERDLAVEKRRIVKRDRTQGKLYQELEQLRSRVQPQSEQSAEQPAFDPALLDQLAELKVQVREVTAKSNKVAAEGKQRFGDFETALGRVIEEVGPLFDQYGRPMPVGDAVLDSEDPAALLHYLGNNPEVAAELADLRPAQIGRRIERIEAQMKVKPQTSAAPKPLQPVNARANPRPVEARLSDEELVRGIRETKFRK